MNWKQWKEWRKEGQEEERKVKNLEINEWVKEEWALYKLKQKQKSISDCIKEPTKRKLKENSHREESEGKRKRKVETWKRKKNGRTE